MSVGGVAGDWIVPAGTSEDPVMLFLHGGGIAFGWNNPLRRELAYLARFAGLCAFGVDYHLIPEYHYPVAHDECYAVYQALIQQGKHIVLVGESSGAVLALATLLRAKAAGLPQPLLCALISPVIDYGFKDARVWQADDPFAHPKFTVEMHKHYLAGNDTTLPDLAPIYADLRGIAPLYVLAGEHEILRGEVDRLALAAHRYSVLMETVFWPNAWRIPTARIRWRPPRISRSLPRPAKCPALNWRWSPPPRTGICSG
jgi:acetyl esterase/lipase